MVQIFSKRVWLVTPELNDRFEKDVLAKLKGSGLMFDFEL